MHKNSPKTHLDTVYLSTSAQPAPLCLTPSVPSTNATPLGCQRTASHVHHRVMDGVEGHHPTLQSSPIASATQAPPQHDGGHGCHRLLSFRGTYFAFCCIHCSTLMFGYVNVSISSHLAVGLKSILIPFPCFLCSIQALDIGIKMDCCQIRIKIISHLL